MSQNYIGWVFFCVCFDVMYSGEYNVFYVTLSVYTPGRLKSYPRGRGLDSHHGQLFSLPGVDIHSE